MKHCICIKYLSNEKLYKKREFHCKNVIVAKKKTLQNSQIRYSI